MKISQTLLNNLIIKRYHRAFGETLSARCDHENMKTRMTHFLFFILFSEPSLPIIPIPTLLTFTHSTVHSNSRFNIQHSTFNFHNLSSFRVVVSTLTVIDFSKLEIISGKIHIYLTTGKIESLPIQVEYHKQSFFQSHYLIMVRTINNLYCNIFYDEGFCGLSVEDHWPYFSPGIVDYLRL